MDYDAELGMTARPVFPPVNPHVWHACASISPDSNLGPARPTSDDPKVMRAIPIAQPGSPHSPVAPLQSAPCPSGKATSPSRSGRVASSPCRADWTRSRGGACGWPCGVRALACWGRADKRWPAEARIKVPAGATSTAWEEKMFHDVPRLFHDVPRKRAHPPILCPTPHRR